MINILVITTYIILLSYVIRTIRNVLYLLFLWQLKEYRIDRMFAHLKTSQGKRLILGPMTLIKWFLLFFIIGGILSEYNMLPYSNQFLGLFGFFAYLIYALIWVIETIIYLRELITKGWKVPLFTPKVIVIMSFVLIFQIIPVLIGSGQLLNGPFLDKFLAPLTALFIIIINVPSLSIKKIILLLAKRKIEQFDKLTVIGITGSYGKTSTKEFLAAILSEKYKVAKTPGFYNTDIGVAKCILKELKPEHQIFVVEMGAYKKGEIKAICNMVKPKIGIITGINEQHLELFGSIKETQKAKFELIDSLPKGGVAIFNGSNKYCLEMAEWAKKREIKAIIFNSSSEVKNIRVFADHLEFSFQDKNKSYRFHANLLGEQSTQNLLSAIHAARSLGMRMEEIQKGVARIVSPVKTMQIVGTKNGTTLIDDTFNANPDGVVAAVEYMKIFKGKKIMVLTPLIELGNESEKIHERLGREITKICDLVILTNFNFSKSFVSGAEKVGGKAKIHIVNAVRSVKILKENLGKDGVLVLEGKEAGRILQQLTVNS